MAKQTSLYLHKGHNATFTTFTSADTTVAKSIFVAGADDSDLKLLQITSNDTSTVNLQLFVRRSSTNYLLGVIQVVTLSGTNGTAAAVNGLNTTQLPGLVFDAMLKAYLPLKAGDEVYAAPLVTMTAAKTLTVTAIGHDY